MSNSPAEIFDRLCVSDAPAGGPAEHRQATRHQIRRAYGTPEDI
jgi:hypothetical protein